MATRIEPPMTRTRSGGNAAHVRTLGTVKETALIEAPASLGYVKYPRAAKAVFAIAAATVVFAIVQSAAILVVTAWLLLVAYMLHVGCRLGGQPIEGITTPYPGGYDGRSIARFGHPHRR